MTNEDRDIDKLYRKIRWRAWLLKIIPWAMRMKIPTVQQGDFTYDNEENAYSEPEIVLCEYKVRRIGGVEGYFYSVNGEIIRYYEGIDTHPCFVNLRDNEQCEHDAVANASYLLTRF